MFTLGTVKGQEEFNSLFCNKLLTDSADWDVNDWWYPDLCVWNDNLISSFDVLSYWFHYSTYSAQKPWKIQLLIAERWLIYDSLFGVTFAFAIISSQRHLTYCVFCFALSHFSIMVLHKYYLLHFKCFGTIIQVLFDVPLNNRITTTQTNKTAYSRYYHKIHES